MFITEFDSAPGIISPENIISKVDNMPEVCIGVFSQVIVKKLVEKYNGVFLTERISVSGNLPIYKICVDGIGFAIFAPFLGGAGSARCMEELIPMGGKYFVFTGSCGVLRHDIADGHLIIPTSAIRDEGLSFHYVEAADEIEMDSRLVGLARDTLSDLHLPFVEGKTWTTDAFYRETKGKMEQAKDMGAICVEMECASLAAVAQYRQVPYVQFLWSADNLDAPEWDRRGIGSERHKSVGEKCMIAAIEIGKRLKDAIHKEEKNEL